MGEAATFHGTTRALDALTPRTVLAEFSLGAGDGGPRRVVIDAPFVRARLLPLMENRSRSRLIL